MSTIATPGLDANDTSRPELPKRAGPNREMALLLLCGGTRLEPDRLDQIRTLVGEGVNWDYLVDLAARHGMTPLLVHHLAALRSKDVPPLILGQLRTAFGHNTRRNLFLAGELLQIVAAAEARGIPVIAYKGPTLALMAFGHLGLRTFDDLDILVRPTDLIPMTAVLESRGYMPEFPINSSRGPAYARFESVLVFHKRDPDSMVELHWRLTPNYFTFPHDPGRVWEELAQVPLAGRSILTLSPEVTLLFLTVHGAKHHWNSLRWVCDLACLLENGGPWDWDRILRRSDEERCRRTLFIGLLLATELTGTRLPPEIVQKSRVDSTANRLATVIRDRFLHFPERPESQFDRLRFLLRCRDRLRDQLRSSLEFAVRPNEGDLHSLSLPARLAPLYYLIRPGRLLGRYGMTLFRRPDADKPGSRSDPGARIPPWTS